MKIKPFDYENLKSGLYWLVVERPDNEAFLKNSGNEISIVKNQSSTHIVMSRICMNANMEWVFKQVDEGKHGNVEDGDVVTQYCEIMKPSLSEIM